ncbi:hypothetical protein B0H63DRAFT_473893, partial [Podospora didyma]
MCTESQCRESRSVFGRRRPFTASAIIFTLGGGLAGGVNNSSLLIAGRSIYGAGAGANVVFLDIPYADIHSLGLRSL